MSESGKFSATDLANQWEIDRSPRVRAPVNQTRKEVGQQHTQNCAGGREESVGGVNQAEQTLAAPFIIPFKELDPLHYKSICFIKTH